jgi:hypothetical protein
MFGRDNRHSRCALTSLRCRFIWGTNAQVLKPPPAQVPLSAPRRSCYQDAPQCFYGDAGASWSVGLLRVGIVFMFLLPAFLQYLLHCVAGYLHASGTGPGFVQLCPPYASGRESRDRRSVLGTQLDDDRDLREVRAVGQEYRATLVAAPATRFVCLAEHEGYSGLSGLIRAYRGLSGSIETYRGLI